MGKAEVVDYRSVNLAWLLEFRDRVLQKELGPEIELVRGISNQETGGFQISQNDTLCVESRHSNSLIVTKPYGDVRKGEIPSSIAEPKPREEWSTEDVCEYIIKRACMSKECTYLETMPRKAVSPKEYHGTFVSQARKCKFTDLVDAIEYFHRLKGKDLSRCFVWLDIFCANQPKLTARNVEESVQKANERQLTEGLHTAIAHFDECIMFMDKWDGATPLKRAWCIWEVFGVAKAKRQLEIALPQREYDRFIVTLKSDYDSVLKVTASVSVEEAECFNPDDLRAIHREIRSKSSFKILDDIIKTQLRLWVASTGKLQLESEEAKERPNKKEIRLLANQAGLTFQDQGDYDAAESLLRKALSTAEEITTDRSTDSVVAIELNNLAELLQLKGKFAEAEPIFVESLAILRRVHGDEHHLIGAILNNLSQLLVAKSGATKDAEALQRQALAIRIKTLGVEHREVAESINNLGLLLQTRGRLQEAEKLFLESLRIRKKVLGLLNPEVAESLNNLAMISQALVSSSCGFAALSVIVDFKGKMDEAEKLMQEALELDKKLFGDSHPNVARGLNNLAQLKAARGNYEQAEKLFREALEISKRVYGVNHPDYALKLNNLANVLMDTGRPEEAEGMFRESLQIMVKSFGRQHPHVAVLLDSLAELMGVLGKDDEAESLFKEALELNRKIFGNGDIKVSTALTRLAMLLAKVGKLKESEPLLRQALAIKKKALGEEHLQVAVALHNLAFVIWRRDNKSKEADRLGKEAVRVATKLLGENHPTTQKYKRNWE